MNAQSKNSVSTPKNTILHELLNWRNYVFFISMPFALMMMFAMPESFDTWGYFALIVGVKAFCGYVMYKMFKWSDTWAKEGKSRWIRAVWKMCED